MYKIIEIQYGEREVIAEFESRDDADKFFDNRVLAFIEGNKEEFDILDDNSDYFCACYEDGDEYELLMSYPKGK